MGTEKSNKITNVKQFEAMVNHLGKNRDLATGFPNFGSSRADVKKKWNEFSTSLNSLGPPLRNGDGWAKVWFDYKNKIKKKLLHNKQELAATGGGHNKLYNFSTLEENVISLLSLNESVNPVGQTFGLNIPVPLELDEDHNARENSSPATETNMEGIPSVRRDPLRPRSTKNLNSKDTTQERLALLKEQTKLLKKYR